MLEEIKKNARVKVSKMFNVNDFSDEFYNCIINEINDCKDYNEINEIIRSSRTISQKLKTIK